MNENELSAWLLLEDAGWELVETSPRWRIRNYKYDIAASRLSTALKTAQELIAKDRTMPKVYFGVII